MHISVVCPRCRDTYKVHESLRGKSMRCIRTTCKHLFRIDDAPPPEPHKATPNSGSVGEMIPLLPVENETPHVADMLEVLPAEVAQPELPLERYQPDEAPPSPDWSAPPPVRRASKPDPVDEPPRSPRKTTKKADDPRVFEAGDWSAPPVRRGTDDDEPPRQRDEPDLFTPPVVDRKPARTDKPETHTDPDLVVKPRTRWVKWVVLSLFLLVFVGGGAGGYFIWKAITETEEKWARDADTSFENTSYDNAANLYDKLAEKYPTSESRPRYLFRKDLAHLLQRMANVDDDPVKVLDHVAEFAREREKDPLMPEHAPKLGEALVKMLAEFANKEREDPQNDDSLKTLDHAKPVVERVKKLKLAKEVKTPDWGKIDEASSALRQAVARMLEKRKVLDEVTELAKAKPSFNTIVAVENYLRDAKERFPDVVGSAEVKKLVDGLYDAHQAAVKYTRATAKTGPIRRASHGQLDEPSILFDPALRLPTGVRPGANADEVPTLALVRGVLYAMSRSTGQVRWARRLGIDTTTLPTHVPQRVAGRDLLLALSSDANTLTALSVRGEVVWTYPLDSPVLGRPVIAERRAYLASYNGEVHEIELVEGKRVGSYHLGQRLTLGGTVEPGTSRVYFPADDGCVYILDVAKQRCDKVLYSGHPAGSLRGEVVVLPPIGDETPGYLVLNQATGLDSVRLRVFDLPIRDARAAERSLRSPATLGGWTWFAPYHDPEKLILLSDAGRLGLFGIRQPNNRDEALFPLLPGGSLDLVGLLGGDPKRRGRSEVAQVEGDDVWVLAADHLQRLRLAWGQTQGPRVVPVWPKALVVGSPLHASQVIEDPTGRSNLVAVTQPPRRDGAWASCIDDENGTLKWRRQLGLVVRCEPVAVPMEKGEPLWLAMDQAGALVGLDPTRYLPGKGALWLSDSKVAIGPAHLTTALEENPNQPPIVLLDGTTVRVVAFPGDGRRLVVRHVAADAGGERKLEVRQEEAPLAEPPAGRPAMFGDRLLLPLADGTLVRVAPGGNVEGGPNWRAERAGADARGVVVALSSTRFLTTDGGRGLMVWDWPAAVPVWSALPANRGDEPTLEMPERVTHIVALSPTLLAVSDSRGGVSLVEVQPRGDLVIKRTWTLGDEITAGPFVRQTAQGVRLACVVDRAKLVWLDPTKAEKLWTYTTPGEDPLVGEPLLVDGRLVVVDQSGLYVALDLKSGSAIGQGYQLRGSVAPVASAVPFQKDRLLAPLSDGTLLLLGVGRLLK